jgi:hypothetical protein
MNISLHVIIDKTGVYDGVRHLNQTTFFFEPTHPIGYRRFGITFTHMVRILKKWDGEKF